MGCAAPWPPRWVWSKGNLPTQPAQSRQLKSKAHLFKPSALRNGRIWNRIGDSGLGCFLDMPEPVSMVWKGGQSKALVTPG